MDAAYVGIDVSKEQLDVSVRPTGMEFCVSRELAGLNELTSQLQGISPVIIALEATGGLEAVVAAHLGAAGLPVIVGAGPRACPGTWQTRED